MPMTSRFHLAFANWVRSDLDRFIPLWGAPDYSVETIKLSVNRFAPHMVIYVSRQGVNVSVEWEDECWDLLYADDISPAKGPMGGWRCSLCLGDDVPEFVTIEQLWEHHLFEAMASWIERVLIPSQVLYLCRRPGASWALLQLSGEPVPCRTLYALFAPDPED